ncbi:hypothetical protein GCM10008908_24790 [Clostridium subterminale]|uniref:Uncharacterized protein n=1 Tax=Clostridium subterminale TaxID=1550 RepID=A0ABP3W5J5_CLOSU
MTDIIYYVALNENMEWDGYFLEDINGYEKCQKVLFKGGIKIDEELHSKLLETGLWKYIGETNRFMHTIDDIDLFKEVVQPVDTTPQPPTIPDTIKSLGEELTQEKLKNIQKDNTISQLGQELANVKLEVIQIKGGV